MDCLKNSIKKITCSLNKKRNIVDEVTKFSNELDELIDKHNKKNKKYMNKEKATEK